MRRKSKWHTSSTTSLLHKRPQHRSDIQLLPSNSRQRFDAVFDAHQKRVRSFCAVIEKKLLPEIRGIVYEHLLSNCATQYVIESFAPSVHHYGHSCLSYFFPKSRLPADPGTRTDVWRFIDYTGDIIGKEIAEAWYQTSRFIIYLGDGLVDQWLSEDVWGRGMVPADLIRNVYVHIPEAACYSLEVKKSNKRHSAREELNLLKRLGNKRVDLTIELEVMTMIALRAVADSVYELQSRRFVDVKVRAYCSLDCNMRANGRFFGVRKDLCSSGCNMKDVGYLFNVRKEVFDELFGEVSDFEGSHTHG